MADHRAEQIMDSFLAIITGLTTTGANVKRDRVYSFTTDTAPALSLFQGDDVPIPYIDRNYYQDDFELTLHVDIHVNEADSVPVSQTLNQIRKEITIAVQNDPRLGLSFVINTEEGTAHRPVIEHIDRVTATQTMDFMIKYRRSRQDPST